MKHQSCLDFYKIGSRWMLRKLPASITGKDIRSLNRMRFEDFCYLAGIIWMPMGVTGSSAFLFGLGMVVVGLGLMVAYVRRNSKATYTDIDLPRREDDTVEFNTQSDDRDNADKR